jgi:hypothetical protein
MGTIDEKKVAVTTKSSFACVDTLLAMISKRKAVDESVIGCKIADTSFATLYRELSCLVSRSKSVLVIFCTS